MHRLLIFTENKTLGRLCKMCNPFFHEFRVIPPAYGFQLFCYTSTHSPQRLYASRLTLIGVLLTVAGGERLEDMFYLATEACKSRLLGQRLLSWEPLVLFNNVFS
jgi:hypothetical protein